jgi:hypothetical protein
MELDEHVADWIDAAAAWWLRELGPIGEDLALPIDEHFPTNTPEALFEAVIGFADMADWNFELVDESETVMDDPIPNLPRPAFPKAILSPEEEDGEPIPEGGPFPIAYSRELAANPMYLIATFVRGISHYLLYTASEDPPGRDEQREAFVEIGAVLMGFGVFLANTAFRFEQIQDGALHGWSSSTHGALGEDALGYALALHGALAGLDPKRALPHLAANPKAAFKRALVRLEGPRRASVEWLRSVVPASHAAGPYR